MTAKRTFRTSRWQGLGARRRGASLSKLNEQPSPAGRGCPAKALSSAIAGRVRGYFRHQPRRCYTVSLRLPTQRVRELRRNQAEAEKAAWHLLRGQRAGTKFRRQCRIENCLVDFYCFEHRLAIELDGGVHSQPSQMHRDAAKEDYLRTLGISLLRIPNGLVLEDPEGFVEKVREAIEAKSRQPEQETPHPSRSGW